MVKADMVLDVHCVPSYIGYTRLARAATRLRAAGVPVRLTFRPFQLAPDAPLDPHPLVTVLKALFGEGAEAYMAHTTGQAAQEGLELKLGRAVVGNSLGAHLLISRAAAQGRAEAVVERLFRACFTDGLHIGDPAVLREIAAGCGVETAHDESRPDGFLLDAPEAADELRAEMDRLRTHGVTGVPIFRIGDRVLCGAQTEAALFGALCEALPSAARGGPVRAAAPPLGCTAGRSRVRVGAVR
ncbi:hypothetical protein CTZ27_13625 [Streptomyces griseocarneus]|nr:hypothetical protein CTZ27_13625 [Streptomyces griseocarneus]